MKTNLKLVHVLLIIVLVFVSMQETDGRRQILKGRKALTRTYLRESAIPAWAVVVLVALGEIIAGGVVYVIMKKLIVDPPITGSYTPAPTEA